MPKKSTVDQVGEPPPGAVRLAQAVQRRRFELGLAQDDLAERGGPSVVTVRQIEQAKLRRPQGLTMSGLDRSLGWESGSAARLWLDGVEPTEGVVWLGPSRTIPRGLTPIEDPTVGGSAQDAPEQQSEEVLFRLPPGLSPRQRETAKQLARQSVQTYLDSLREE